MLYYIILYYIILYYYIYILHGGTVDRRPAAMGTARRCRPVAGIRHGRCRGHTRTRSDAQSRPGRPGRPGPAGERLSHFLSRNGICLWVGRVGRVGRDERPSALGCWGRQCLRLGPVPAGLLARPAGQRYPLLPFCFGGMPVGDDSDTLRPGDLLLQRPPSRCGDASLPIAAPLPIAAGGRKGAVCAKSSPAGAAGPLQQKTHPCPSPPTGDWPIAAQLLMYGPKKL